MKKLLLFSALFLLFTVHTAQAQIEIGLKAGVNFASLTGDDFSDWDGKTGLHVGAYLIYMFSEALGIQVEALYSGVGGEFSDSSFDSEFALDYLTFPILLRLHILAGLHAVAGLQLAFLLSAEDGDTDISDFITSTDFSAVLGVAYTILRFNFFARYLIGLTEIDDSGSFDAKNGVFQLGVGFRLLGGSD